ncbi:MAG TPA: sialidase family protein, partial [Mycobacterium sp.]|nr:sialidase family protein [Mycobacterium sp.]
PGLVANGTLVARNAVQVIDIRGATGGTFRLGWDANNNGTLEPAEISAPITFVAATNLVGPIKTAIEGITGIGAGNTTVSRSGESYLVAFTGGAVAGKSIKPLVVVDATTLATQNDVQSVEPLDATGGTYTLTFGFGLTPLALTALSAPGVGSLAAGTYFYEVTALTPTGETVASKEVSAVLTGVGEVMLGWTAVPGATGYRIYRGTTTGGENLYIAPTGTLVNFTDDNTDTHTPGSPPSSSAARVTKTSGPIPYNAPADGSNRPTGVGAVASAAGTLASGTYSYVVSAVTATGESIASTETSATLASAGTITVSWTAVAGATGYRIYRGKSAGGENTYFTATAVSFADDGSHGAGTAATPFTQSLQAVLETTIENALGLGAGTNVAVGIVNGAYAVTFQGALAGVHVDPLTGDAGGLLNGNPFATFSASIDKSTTTSNTTAAQLVAQVQSAIDKAAIAAGITPGFLVSNLITDGSSFKANDLTYGAVPFGAPHFTPQGPAPAQNGMVEGMTNNPVAGAVEVALPHPTNQDVMWVATVNGGIFKTANATAVSPHWTAEVNVGPASISSLQLDPTVADHSVLIAGIGDVSNFGSGSAETGLLRSTDGGATWTRIGTTQLSGLRILNVVERGNVIVVAGRDFSGSNKTGVWRSTDTGNTFYRITGDGVSGLPRGAGFDIVGDPGDSSRLYTGISGTTGGVFTSTDLGATWTATGGMGNELNGNPIIAATVTNIRIAVHDDGVNNVVYAGVVKDYTGLNPTPACGSFCDRLAGLFASVNHGTAWTPLDLPGTCEGTHPQGDPRCANGIFIGLHDGNQGVSNFSIGADPTSASIVYVAGDTQDDGVGPDGILGTNDDLTLNGGANANSEGAHQYTGRIFRCASTGVAGAQCTWITNSHTDTNTSPHSDSRSIAFQAVSGALLETDDGGIFRRSTPSSTNVLAYGDWTSLNGDLQIAEEHSCFYDHAAQVIFCGNQDNGDSQQSALGSTTWNMVPQGDGFIADGAKVAVGYNGASSVQYWSRQFLGGLSRRTCSPACGASTLLGLLVTTNAQPTLATAFCAAHPTLLRCTDTGTQFYTVIAADTADATGAQVVLGTSGNVYESLNNGDSLTRINLPNGGVVSALAYGGVDSGTSHAD